MTGSTDRGVREQRFAPRSAPSTIVPAVVQQHVDDAASLATTRFHLTRSAHATLGYFRRFDQRLESNLDGLRLGGESARAMCYATLEQPSRGGLFACVVAAIEGADDARLDGLLALSQAVPETRDGLLCGFGWVEPSWLRGTVARLLSDSNPFRRMIGVAACAMHRVDPGIGSGKFLHDPHPAVRARAFRAAGELGLSSVASSCVAALGREDDGEVQFWAAWSAVLLGDRNRGLEVLTERGLSAGAHRARSFRLALQAMNSGAAHGFLRRLSGDPRNRRWLIHGSGIVGDPAYVPWLVKQMGAVPDARLAGEAFSTISGINLAQNALDQPAPENFASGPNDDPDDPNVDMDPDEDLSWPHVERVDQWWTENSSRFPTGTCCFMGAPVTRQHCLDVLKKGYQRQRIVAAHYLCLLDPGTPLFNTSAPAWRQQRLLARMQ